MGIKINAEILHYALSVVFLKGISLLMLPIVTHFLPPDDYGTLNFLVSIVAMLSIVLSFGLAEVIFRFGPEHCKEGALTFIHASIRMSAHIAILFAVIAIVTTPIWLMLIPVSVQAWDLVLLFINLAFCVVIGQFLAMYRFQKRSTTYLKVALSQGVIHSLLTLTFLNLGWSISGVLLSGALASFVVTLFLVIPNHKIWRSRHQGITSTHLKYASFITLASLYLYALGGVENWFIVGVFGPEQLALYFIATQFALALSLSFEPFRMWWYPKRFSQFLDSANRAPKGQY